MSASAVIVGAGIIGSSIAWRLAARGIKVTLLDAGRLGAEASWAGAGMLAPGGEIVERSPWSELALESLRLYPEFVRELSSASGMSIDFQQQGAVEAAFDDAELADLDRRALRQQAIGIDSERLDAADARWLGPNVAGARFYPSDALVDPRDITAALRSACLARSVEIREGVRAERIDTGAHEVRIATTAGTVTADRAVLAAGAWSSGIRVLVEGSEFALPQAFPVRGHLIGYHLPAGSIGPILRHGHTYVLQRQSGFTIAGTSSEEAGFDRTVDDATVAEIRGRAARLAVSLQGMEPAEAWTGFRPGIRADGPAIGRAGESALWLAYGHYRNGILLAPATAERVAREILAPAPRK